MDRRKIILAIVVLLEVTGISFAVFPAHAATSWPVLLDASSTSTSDANPQTSNAVVNTFNLGVIVEANSTTPLNGVFGWQFGIIYDNTTVLPQGDPVAFGASDNAGPTVNFGSQTGTGNPNWAAKVVSGQAFVLSGLIDPGIDNHHNEIVVALALLPPSPSVNIGPVATVTVKGNLLANVAFELIRPANGLSFSLDASKTLFVDNTGVVIPGTVIGPPVTETITNSPPVASFTATHLPNGDPSCTATTGTLCSAFAFKFDGSASSDSDGTIVDPEGYFWDFGDGTQDNVNVGFSCLLLNCNQGVIAIHDYGTAGAFTTTLRVVDDQAATGSARDPLGTQICNTQPSHIANPPRCTTTSVLCSPSSPAVNTPAACSMTVTDTAPGTLITPTGSFALTTDLAGSFGGLCVLSEIVQGTASCSVTYTPTVTGVHTIGVTYPGDNSHSSSGTSTEVFVGDGTTTTVSCDSPVLVDQPSMCTATVTDTSTNPAAPTGMVTFTSTGAGSFVSMSCTLGAPTSNSAGCQVSYTPIAVGTGTHTITGSYAGDSLHFASSGIFDLIVTSTVHTTNTGVACSPSPVAVGVSTNCTATVTDTATGPTTPTGTITFTPGGTCTLAGIGASASCSVSITPTAAGPLSVSGSYGSDSTHATSSGSATVTVNLHATSTTVSCPATDTVGVALTCSASVVDTSPGTATTPMGTVTWTHTNTGTFSAATCTLVSGSCSVSYTPSATGSHTITGSYGRDTTHSVSDGSTTVIVQNPPAADFSIRASPASVTIPPDTGISTITIAPTSGFTGMVDLTSTIFPATGLTCTLTPTSITGGAGTSMLSCSGLAGSYTVTVTGTNGLLSHSVDVIFIIAPAADFTIFASPATVTVKVGDTGTSTIVVNRFNGLTSTVDLSHVESPPTGLTCSLSPTSVTGGSGSSTLSCSGVAGIYTVTVSGVSGTASHSADVSFIVTSAPDFKITASPASVNMVAGDTGISTITISPVNSFTATVDLTHLESPVGLTCSLSPTIITSGSGTSTLSCIGSVGIYTVTVSGTSGLLTHSVRVTFIVTPPLDFAISTSPTSVTIVEGETGTSTITVDSLNSFTGTVSLTSTISPGAGLTCSVSPTDIILGSSGTSTLSCTGTEGTYTVTVTGTSGSLIHSINVEFIVILPFDFGISANPTRVTVAEGSTGTSTITIAPLNGFTGTVDLTHSLSVGTGLTCSLNPTSIVGGSGTSTLSCNGSAGTYAVTITGTSGALSHSLDVIFDVTALPDFTIHASPTSVSLIASGTGTSTITVTSVNGFSATVGLSGTTSPATGLTCNFSPTSITGGSGTSTLSCSGSAGTYTVTVTGTSGTPSHSVDVMFTVTAPPPDFAISAIPTSVTLAQGSSGTSTIMVTSLNGFTGTVDLAGSVSPATGLTCTLAPTSITGGSGTSTLFCTGTANTFTVTVTGTSGLLSHTAVVTFDVRSLTPAQASQNLIDAVKSLHLSGSAQTSLLGPLNNIVKILSDKDPTNDTSGCDKLSSFVNTVNNDQRKGILTMEQAAQLRQLAASIMAQLGC